MANIIIPSPLRKFTEHNAQVVTKGATIKEALLLLVEKYRSLEKHLFDEKNELRSFIRVYLEEDDINSLDQTETKIDEHSVITIVPAIAGGKSLRLGDVAPDFSADSTEGRINFHEWIGEGWAVLFSHPADFTPVCTTELGTVAKYKEKFADRNTKVIALSVDPITDHQKWILDINETQNTDVNFPLIADENKRVAELYDMIHPNASQTATVRSVFVIGPDKKIKLTLTYPPATGRNFDEILRVIDSLQLTAYKKVATPANWRNGEEVVILPSLTKEEVSNDFPQGYRELKPYLKLTKV